MVIQNRINSLRKIMKKEKLDYYLIPHEDESLLEYTSSKMERLKWISGFSGSAGNLVVGKKEINLFVDSRYKIQSKKEMIDIECNIYDIAEKSYYDFFKEIKEKKVCLGIFAKTISVKNFSLINNICINKGIKIVDLNTDLIDRIWKRNLKTQKTNKVFLLDDKFTGQNYEKKIKKIFNYMQSEKTDLIYIQNSESIAWLLNLRGADLDFTPIILSNAIISKKKIYLFLENENLPYYIKKKLKKYVNFLNKKQFENTLRKLAKKELNIMTDDKSTSIYNFKILKKYSENICIKDDVLQSYKSIKNITEIKCFKKAHLLDGKAFCKFLFWFKERKKPISELDIVKKIDNLRSKNNGFLSRSFPTIAGSGPNGAIIHYQANMKTNRILNNNDILLLDSGAQYLFGTTDITRTISRGKVSKEQILDYTLVLKGHLKINLAKFPFGVRGNYLDFIARQNLWNFGKDYSHSTGHGIGFCLNVHEGPFNISTRSSSIISSGMVFSNEPGYYRNNHYGIRIENVVMAKSFKINKKRFIKINNFTMAPYEWSLIDVKMLHKEEKDWINNYHKKVVKEISPLLKEKERVWLKEYCKEIR